MGIVNKMRSHGNKIEDEAVVEKILRSLEPRFDNVMFFLEESKDIDAITINELQSSLLVHERRLNKRLAVKDIHALKVLTCDEGSSSRGRDNGKAGKSHGRGRKARGNHYVGGNKDDGKSSKKIEDHINKGRRHFDKSKVECYRCHNFGHYCSKCYTKLPKYKKKGRKVQFC